jgi:hypothetical protein
VTSIGHVHEWGPERRVDRCHTIDRERRCVACQELRIDPEPRDFTEPGAVAFADENCPICRERVALDGVWPDSWGALV